MTEPTQPFDTMAGAAGGTAEEATVPLADVTPGAAGGGTDGATNDAPVSLRPRVRWAGIVWGLVFLVLAVVGIRFSTEPGLFDDLAAWLQHVEVGAAVGYGLLAIGALALVTGLVGLLRRAQRALAARRAGS
ncbi:hypothetical protein [Microbacterium sp.]|uniref:hypothetical protein n=1 Tax=Microbacterium sp. TaxID=51671 RepID=UPI0039E6C75F